MKLSEAVTVLSEAVLSEAVLVLEMRAEHEHEDQFSDLSSTSTDSRPNEPFEVILSEAVLEMRAEHEHEFSD